MIRLAILLVLLANCASNQLVIPKNECQLVMWNPARIPLKLYVMDDDIVGSSIAAANFWAPYVVLNETAPDAVIFTWSSTDTGQTRVLADECMFAFGAIAVPEDAPFQLVAHEIGHLLGLAHDPEDIESIMHPEIYLSGIDYHIQETDKEVLHLLYGSQE